MTFSAPKYKFSSELFQGCKIKRHISGHFKNGENPVIIKAGS